MLKLPRNALGSIQSFHGEDGGEIQCPYFQQVYHLQEPEGFNLGNKFVKHKMNVRLVAQTIEFLDVSMKLAPFNNSQATVNFIRILMEHLTH